ncbi:MAG: Fe2+-dependent dioxygenase [Gammaproteobacteria bacterium]|nr:MAG: Fe2+-dependent dioxygenase [Gammaproteobacteria bacterium]
MLLTIPQVLDQKQLEKVRAIIARAPFVDGRLSAGLAARRVKHNEELAPGTRALEMLNDIVMGSLVKHPVYLHGALPLRVATPFYARYRKGMGYGEHVDDPIMGPGPRYRSDIAITVFLNDPESYQGGELVIRTTFGEQRVKLPAGDAVMYPASSLHRVEEVTQGERLVAVTWVQSMVRDPEKRALLYDLHLAREKLLERAPDHEETARVSAVYVNLVRMWAEL